VLIKKIIRIIEIALAGLTASAADTNTQPHWAFQPIAHPSVPAVKNTAWPATDIDRFILAKLEERGLQPSAPASKRILIRRATFDLTGLPPAPEELEAFQTDSSPEAFARLIDRLLASPRYGERWGRHWLDVARYADSNGMDENLAYASAWRYRDYVVAAFNKDKPYSQFIREQLAGDLLPSTGTTNDFEHLIATGFLMIGPKMLAEDDPVKMEMDIIDEQLDTMSRAFMGLTVGCGRCHDHKYDPVPTSDYYAMAGIFKSTRTMENFKVVARWHESPLGTPEEIERLAGHRKRLEQQNKLVAEIIAEANTNLLREARARAADYLAAAKLASSSDRTANGPTGLIPEFEKQWTEYLKKTERPPEPDSEAFQKLIEDSKGPFALPKNAEVYYPHERAAQLKEARQQSKVLEETLPALPETMAVSDGAVQNLRVHKRGSHLSLGDETTRGFLKSIGAPEPPALGTNASGRLQLAEWMTLPEHPLTARVMANRIWLWHFGEGLVRSPDNFGALGEKPTHPELLDWLARRFVESGWSVKAMHRLIMNSAVYQQASLRVISKSVISESVKSPASETDLLITDSLITKNFPNPAILDPENRLLSRFPRRRLEVEAIRDSILFVSGGLDVSMGGSLLTVTNRAYVTSTANKLDSSLFDRPRRSVYLPVVRSALYDVFQVFDFADPSTINGRRDQTTVAPQALFMLNSKLVADAASRLAGHLLAEDKLDDDGRLKKLYGSAYSRTPNEPEREAALKYLRNYAQATEQRGTKPEVSRVQAWQSLARSVMAANEFIYVE
jgi:hypothetical protein